MSASEYFKTDHLSVFMKDSNLKLNLWKFGRQDYIYLRSWQIEITEQVKSGYKNEETGTRFQVTTTFSD